MNLKLKRVIKFIYFAVPAILFAGIIFYLSSFSQIDVPVHFDFSDKIIHALFYTILGWLLLRALHFGRIESVPMKLLLLTVIIGTVYGLSDEFHQFFVPGRQTDLFDWLADTIGVVVGAQLYRKSHRFEMRFIQFAWRSLS